MKAARTTVTCPECGVRMSALSAPSDGACPQGCDAWLVRAEPRVVDDEPDAADDDQMTDGERRRRGVAAQGGPRVVDDESNAADDSVARGDGIENDAAAWDRTVGPWRRRRASKRGGQARLL